MDGSMDYAAKARVREQENCAQGHSYDRRSNYGVVMAALYRSTIFEWSCLRIVGSSMVCHPLVAVLKPRPVMYFHLPFGGFSRKSWRPAGVLSRRVRVFDLLRSWFPCTVRHYWWFCWYVIRIGCFPHVLT